MLIAAMAAATLSPDMAIGRWRTGHRNGVVEIARCGPSICGTLLDSDGLHENPHLTDANNKDTAQRARPLKGLRLMQGFTRGDGAWTGGTIYNPEDGGTYKATVTPASEDRLTLKGCIIWPLCKTQNWTRLR